MANQRILPLGFLDRTTDGGAIIMLTNPSDSHGLRHNTPVTLQAKSTTNAEATAKARGLITAVGYVTATFKVVETRTDAGWPEGEQILKRGTPVYQALPDSFNPDPRRALSEEQAKGLSHLADRYREALRPPRPTSDNTAGTSQNGLHPDR